MTLFASTLWSSRFGLYLFPLSTNKNKKNLILGEKLKSRLEQPQLHANQPTEPKPTSTILVHLPWFRFASRSLHLPCFFSFHLTSIFTHQAPPGSSLFNFFFFLSRTYFLSPDTSLNSGRKSFHITCYYGEGVNRKGLTQYYREEKP